MEDNEKVVKIMDSACKDEAVARAMDRLWKKRVATCVPIPQQA